MLNLGDGFETEADEDSLRSAAEDKDSGIGTIQRHWPKPFD